MEDFDSVLCPINPVTCHLDPLPPRLWEKPRILCKRDYVNNLPQLKHYQTCLWIT
jgi:hypothetical protein